ncbi:MAG: hypothetical protein IKJ33_01175 [Clostridia bacterium]|nr:hypothetical protein [Clostridia bacterium]
MSLNPQDLQKGNFDSVIKLCSDQARRLKDKPDRAQKYEDAKKQLQAAKAKVDKIIETTKDIKMKSGNSFYKDFIEGKENLVTLFWLSQKIENEKNAGTIDITATVAKKVDIDKIDFSAPDVDPNFDMVDQTKSFANQILNGKGASKWLTRGCLAVGIGELLAQGITSSLVKEGIMAEAMGLFGVLKMGVIEGLPALWSSLCGGVTALAGFSPLLLGAGVGVVALTTIPLIKKLVDKVKTNHKNNQAFNTGVDKLLASQQSTNLQP